ncbi:hypothetical protein ACVIHC_002220 [Bradyrhizobium diazoefficiens]
MSRTTDAYQNHCDKMEGFDEWLDAQRGAVTDEDMQRMYEQQAIKFKRREGTANTSFPQQ